MDAIAVATSVLGELPLSGINRPVKAKIRPESVAAGYPGRKNLFWLSGSFPFSLTQESQYNITAPLQYSTLNAPNMPTADTTAVADTSKVIADAQIAV